MTRAFPRSLWIPLLFALVAGPLGGENNNRPEASRIAGLIEQLGHLRFARREAAGKELVSIGMAALRPLREATKSEDLEIRERARKLIVVILKKETVSKSTGIKMAVIEPGTFLMGSPNNESGRASSEPQHIVRLSMPYLIGAHEVTQDVYQKVMKYNPSDHSATGASKHKIVANKTEKFPVENVSWFDAVEFCNRLSTLDGLPPYYKITEKKLEGKKIRTATVAILGGNGYRLPTEAEWEHACRAATTNRFHFGYRNTGKEANVKATRRTGGYGTISIAFKDLKRATTVGSYKPNAWGLFDMHGNVGEWCADWYDSSYYRNSPKVDPKGPDKGIHRVVRGGSWLVAETSCRSASRFYLTPGSTNFYTGFRVARGP